MMHRLENPLYTERFKTLRSIKIPKALMVLKVLLLFAFIFTALFLIFTPWVQTSKGTGQITALNPEDRVQAVNALVDGRIKYWHVRDGAKVKMGDPLVEILDNDPDLVSRLEGERDAIQEKLSALENAARTAELDLDRQQALLEKGLSSKRDKELALIKLENAKSIVSSARAELNTAAVKLSRQNTQLIRAPRDGTILNINAGDAATFVKTGDILATFLPDNVVPAVEIYVSGLDAPLVYAGREVRLVFEGWPAVQFSGWPSLAVGTFKGVVQFVDPALSPNGRIRVLVTKPDDATWPAPKFMRFGARAQAWVLLDKVSLGYELWRQLNGFPPEFSTEAESAARAQWGTY